ncbi:MAG: hypothetical protein H7Y17_07320 [Chlorobia bacterium]|nr:hypothetical protein [Fimbriimonadaceae bacterium]
MTMLHLYQLALISTIVGTIAIANWARRQMAGQSRIVAQTIKEPEQTVNPIPNVMKLASPVTYSVKERVKALDKLFDENVISIDEYVELRRRAIG